MMNTKSADNPNSVKWFEEDYANERFAESIKTLPKTLPLPLERIRKPDPHRLVDLSEKIEIADKEHSQVRLAHTLTSRELGLVFPLLAAISIRPAPDKQATRQARHLLTGLNLIIRERACNSLYDSGWLAFQYHYPNEELAKALTLLCRILDIKHSTFKPAPKIRLNPNSESKHLIGDLAPPTSKQFIPRLIKEIPDQGGIQAFIDKYCINPTLPFGNSLVTQAFLSDGTAMDQGSQMMFAAVLNQNEPETQIELLQHFFNQKDLPDDIYNKFCQQIFKLFDDPQADHPIWSQVRPKTKKAFQNWVRSATIGSHCRKNREKALLLLKYKDDINNVEHWNKDTLLIQFRTFLIADSKKWTDHAIYYPNIGDVNPFELSTGEFNPNPADPAIPRKPIENAIREQDFSEPVDLPFDQHGIRQTAVFLDMLMGKDSSQILKNLRKHLPG